LKTTIYEFNNGLINKNNTVTLKITDGEKYLFVGNNGLQTIGIDNAIAAAVKEPKKQI
jgi:hypothetical protein